MNFRTLTSLMRSSTKTGASTSLPVCVRGIYGVFLTVMGGFHAFLVRSQEMPRRYFLTVSTVRCRRIYSQQRSIAAALIVAPLITLSHATRRRCSGGT